MSCMRCALRLQSPLRALRTHRLPGPLLHRARSLSSTSSPTSPPILPSPPSVHTSADYRALRVHEQSLWQSLFSHTPFPNHFRPSHSVPSFLAQFASLPASFRLPSQPVSLAGRITAKRTASAKLAFLDLRAQQARVQVLASRKEWAGGEGEDSGWGLLKLLRIGDIVGVTGFPGKSQKGELSLIPTSITPLVPCLHDLPLSVAGSSSGSGPAAAAQAIESRFRQRHVDMLLNPASVSVLHTRSLVLTTLRGFLTARGFLEVETPILWPSAGGANARPFLTHSHALSTPLYLRVAPELFLKQLVIGGVERVFEVSKVFRNEGVDSTHNPEFTTVELYEAYSDYEGMMRLTEDLLRDIVRAVKLSRGESGDELTVRLPEGGEGPGTVIDFAPAFQRMDIMATLASLMGTELPDPNEQASIPAYLDLFRTRGVALPAAPHSLPRLLDRLIGHFLEPLCTQPTFLLHHPVSLSPLAHSRPGSAVTERWELFIGGREYVNAYSELNDWREQARRMKVGQDEKEGGDEEAQGVDDEYLRAMEYGLPPTGGWGMGVDRLVMLLTGSRHIRDVIFFPIMKRDQQPQHSAPHPSSSSPLSLSQTPVL